MAAGNLNEALKDSGAGSGQSRKHERLRSVLVVSEVALACVLLVGAGLLLRSFLQVIDIDLGFQPEHAAAVNVDHEDDPADGNGNTPDSRKAILAHRAVYLSAGASAHQRAPRLHAAGISDYFPSVRTARGVSVSQGGQSPKSRTARGRSSTSSRPATWRDGNEHPRARLHME